MTEIITTHQYQSVMFNNTRAVIHNDPVHCGAYNFVLSPSYPFVNVVNSTTSNYQIDVFTNDISIAGEYPMQITVSLPDWPSIPPLTKQFTVFIYCNVQQITANVAPPAYNEFIIGIDPHLTLPINYT
jgi:hypothetical protein